MKKSLIYICVSILLVVAIVTPLRYMSMVFMGDESPRQVDSLYAQPRNSIDVLCVGSSRIYCNIAPDVMWREYGIAAYNLATAAQPLNLTYYALQEALKTQTPKVVVVDVSMAIDDLQPNDQLETMGLQNGMKYSANQISALTDHADKEHLPEYLLRFPCFHNNYSMLTKRDFTKLEYNEFPGAGAAGFKGYINKSYDYHPEEIPSEITLMDDPIALARYNELGKINDLCVKHNIPLLLVLTPSAKYTEYEAAVRFALDNNLNYVNYMYLLGELDINGEGDFVDEVHCNYYGAAKVSRHLAQYVMDNYGITSHAGDSAYASWDEYANYLALTENNYYLAKETGLGNYFNYIPNKDYMIITSLKGDYDVRDVGQLSVLSKLGCNEVAYRMGGTWVMDGTNLEYYYSFGSGECDWHEDMYGSSFYITNKGSDDENDIDIYIDGEKFYIEDEDGERIEDGIQIIVYDKLSQKIVDAVIFDSVHDYRIVRKNY